MHVMHSLMHMVFRSFFNIFIFRPINAKRYHEHIEKEGTWYLFALMGRIL